MAESLYSVLYKMSLAIKIGDSNINITPSDIISVSILEYYDDYVAPIVRLRMYSDLTVAEKITENPNNIFVSIYMNGGVYRLVENEAPELVLPVEPLSISQKAYTENKNSPVSSMDNYQAGLKKSSDLNVQNKVPIELYLYNEQIVSAMNFKASYIFKNMTLYTVIDTILAKQNIVDKKIHPFDNNKIYDQILVPNMKLSDTIAYFDYQYGLYKKGGQLFSDFNKVIITSSDVTNGSTPVPLYVESYKNASTTSGMKKINNKYFMKTLAQSASITTTSEIDKIINAKKMNVSNINTLDTKKYVIDELYADKDNSESILQIIHKTQNEYIGDANKARLCENLTKIDISGAGFDISKFNIDTRFNVIFQDKFPIEGLFDFAYFQLKN